jgi:hypothetical protein
LGGQVEQGGTHRNAPRKNAAEVETDQGEQVARDAVLSAVKEMRMRLIAMLVGALALTGCATDPVSMRARGPAAEPTTYAAPFLQLARCAAREYSAMPAGLLLAPTGFLREFPDDGYVEVMAVAATTLAMTEFRRVNDATTEVRIYQGETLFIGEIARSMDAVHRDCAEGRRTGKPTPQ